MDEIRRTRYTLHHVMGHIACRLITAVSLTEAEVYGAEFLERLPRPYLLVMNHCSHWDPVEVWAYFPDFLNFIVKEELHSVPIFGTMSAISGNIPVVREGVDVTAIKGALRLLRNGFNLGVFAEGTRSDDGQVAPFKEGAVAIAARAKVPIVPMYIHGTHRILPRKSRLIRANRVRLCILNPDLRTLNGDLGKDQMAAITLELEQRVRNAQNLQNSKDLRSVLRTV